MIVFCLRHYIKCFQSPDTILTCTENASGDGLFIWAFLQSLLPPQISTLSPASLPPCEENWKLDFVHRPLGCTEVQRAKEEGGNPVRKAAFRCDHCTFFKIQLDLSWFQTESLLFENYRKMGSAHCWNWLFSPLSDLLWSCFSWKRIWNME